MQKRYYNKEKVNKLIVVKKPVFISSNSYLTSIKRKYKNKKAGFSGTLDPFASGCLIVAFGQYLKLFNYFSKTPKTYEAVIWLGTTSKSLDMENIISVDKEKEINLEKLKEVLESTKGEIKYIPPKFSAKKINGKRAYELARKNEEVKLKESVMNISDIKFIKYYHPFIVFRASVSEGTYIRSLAQIILEKLNLKGTLSSLKRLNEGAFFYENEKELNPLDYIDLPRNVYTGTQEWLKHGKKISIDYLNTKDNGRYLLVFDTFFSIIEVVDKEVKYLLNGIETNGKI